MLPGLFRRRDLDETSTLVYYSHFVDYIVDHIPLPVCFENTNSKRARTGNDDLEEEGVVGSRRTHRH